MLLSSEGEVLDLSEWEIRISLLFLQEELHNELRSHPEEG